MSRIVNIGDFYRTQNSTPSVIENIEIPGGVSYVYSTYAGSTVVNAPSGPTGVTGSTGPIDLLTTAYPPNVGLYVSFFLDTGSSGPYPVTETGFGTGGYFFNISTPLPGEMTSTNCYVYADATGNDYIRTIGIETGSSGDTQIIVGRQPIGSGNALVMYNESGSNDPLYLGSITNTPTGSIVFLVGGTGPGETIDQDYNGYFAHIQESSEIANSASRGNAHAKRQFGNHPRIQR